MTFGVIVTGDGSDAEAQVERARREYWEGERQNALWEEAFGEPFDFQCLGYDRFFVMIGGKEVLGATMDEIMRFDELIPAAKEALAKLEAAHK